MEWQTQDLQNTLHTKNKVRKFFILTISILFMTKDLGRINKLKDSIDTLNYITNAIKRIKDETGIDWDAAPEKSITAARKKLKELETK